MWTNKYLLICFKKLRISDFISNIIVFLYSLNNNSNCVRKSAYSIVFDGIQNLCPLQSKLFSSSVKRYEVKVKITLLGSCEDLQSVTKIIETHYTFIKKLHKKRLDLLKVTQNPPSP